MRSPNIEKMKNAVAYYRVSTKKQGKSGLGLEVQSEVVNGFLQLHHFTLDKEFIEIESGKKKDRIVLKKALRYCKKNDAILVIAKIDRLARDVFFVAMLIESGVRFIVADKPHASPLDHMEDAIRAQREGEIISQRTKDALQRAKRRGISLGKQGKILAEQNKIASMNFAIKLNPVITEIKSEGYRTVQAITNELNRRKISTYRIGSKWHKSTVHKVLSLI